MTNQGATNFRIFHCQLYSLNYKRLFSYIDKHTRKRQKLKSVQLWRRPVAIYQNLPKAGYDSILGRQVRPVKCISNYLKTDANVFEQINFIQTQIQVWIIRYALWIVIQANRFRTQEFKRANLNRPWIFWHESNDLDPESTGGSRIQSCRAHALSTEETVYLYMLIKKCLC